jgi:hypothetical protein
MQGEMHGPRRLEHGVSILSSPKIERKDMDHKVIERMFGRMGARVSITGDVSRRNPAGINVGRDKLGEYFDIRVDASEKVEYEVIDIQPRMKHLLLMARRESRKEKFLCGHDERHWFVCAVPGASVSSVVNAMDALQPVFVRGAVHHRIKRAKERLRRKNKAFVRQGEWFFVPVPMLEVNDKLIVRNEPLSRGWGSKPHMCQFLFRTAGVVVWVCGRYPQGVTTNQYRRLLLTEPGAKGWDWKQMMRDPTVYVRGRVWHPDHKTIVLDSWHRVFMNTEAQAPGARSVVFLD